MSESILISSPVLDVDHHVSEIIGQRSLSADPEIVIELSKTMIGALHRAHMPVVGKHFPGHGGVAADSHLDLPTDARSWETLSHCDLIPFTALSPQLDAIMPAHVLYSAIDSKPASFSPYWLQDVLRQQLQFKGAIITDDLTMAAAASAGGYYERAGQALEAGCDILTVCNNRSGAEAILDGFTNYRNARSQSYIARFVRRVNSYE